MYHIMLMPTDRTGENPDWKSSEPYYDDYYCIWDTFRSSSPLLTLISPDRQRDIIRSLVDIYRHTGYMPDARSGNDNGRTQGGSNANVVVADAFVKGLKGIDYETAFAAMVHDAEVPPADAQKEGRGGLKDYNEKGFVTLADERSGSRTAEYSYDDFSISEVACGLDKPKEAALYASRAHNFETPLGQGHDRRRLQGLHAPAQPRRHLGPALSRRPRHLARLLLRRRHLDLLHLRPAGYAPPHRDGRRQSRCSSTVSTGPSSVATSTSPTNPASSSPCSTTTPVVPTRPPTSFALLLEKAFTDNRAGIPGNDDSGAMSSWLIFSTLGLFPVAGQDVYLISTPSIPDASLYSRQRQKTPHRRKEPRHQRPESLRPVGHSERSRSPHVMVPPRPDQGRRNPGPHDGSGPFKLGQNHSTAFDE